MIQQKEYGRNRLWHSSKNYSRFIPSQWTLLPSVCFAPDCPLRICFCDFLIVIKSRFKEELIKTIILLTNESSKEMNNKNNQGPCKIQAFARGLRSTEEAFLLPTQQPMVLIPASLTIFIFSSRARHYKKM